MYICVCKGVTDHQIEIAIESGLCSRKKLSQNLGVGVTCGKCVKHLDQMLDNNPQQYSIMRQAS